jgi:hypothetical protein
MAARWMASNVRTGIGTGSSARLKCGRRHFDGAYSADYAADGMAGEPRSRRALIHFQTPDSSRPRENRLIPRSTDGNYQPIDGRAPRTIRDRSSFRSVSLQIGQDVTQFHHRSSCRYFSSSRQRCPNPRRWPGRERRVCREARSDSISDTLPCGLSGPI